MLFMKLGSPWLRGRGARVCTGDPSQSCIIIASSWDVSNQRICDSFSNSFYRFQHISFCLCTCILRPLFGDAVRIIKRVLAIFEPRIFTSFSTSNHSETRNSTFCFAVFFHADDLLSLAWLKNCRLGLSILRGGVMLILYDSPKCLATTYFSCKIRYNTSLYLFPHLSYIFHLSNEFTSYASPTVPYEG